VFYHSGYEKPPYGEFSLAVPFSILSPIAALLTANLSSAFTALLGMGHTQFLALRYSRFRVSTASLFSGLT
jgi:hypothetical protein